MTGRGAHDAPEAAAAARRAEHSFAAIRASRLYRARHHLYGRRRWWLWRSYETLWPLADAWSATTTLASIGSEPATAALPELVVALAAYHRDRAALGGSGAIGFESSVVPPLGGGGDVYYDDNAWVGLALVRQHDLTGDERALTLAERIFAFVTSGWSAEASWSWPGGIRWKQPRSDVSRNTCSNGPVAELAALLHLRTGSADALEWAVRIYDWVRSALRGDDGLYLDRVAPDGGREPTTWTYNQGTMIGAGVLLHRITGEAAYLEHAVQTARASLERFGPAELAVNGAAFNAVFFRNLLLLDEVSHDPARLRLASDYGERMWEGSRDPRTGLFSGTGSPLNNSAPMVEVYALLAGAAPHP